MHFLSLCILRAVIHIAEEPDHHTYQAISKHPDKIMDNTKQLCQILLLNNQEERACHRPFTGPPRIYPSTYPPLPFPDFSHIYGRAPPWPCAPRLTGTSQGCPMSLVMCLIFRSAVVASCLVSAQGPHTVPRLFACWGSVGERVRVRKLVRDVRASPRVE